MCGLQTSPKTVDLRQALWREIVSQAKIGQLISTTVALQGTGQAVLAHIERRGRRIYKDDKRNTWRGLGSRPKSPNVQALVGSRKREHLC
jgi:hypothetical protein